MDPQQVILVKEDASRRKPSLLAIVAALALVYIVIQYIRQKVSYAKQCIVCRDKSRTIILLYSYRDTRAVATTVTSLLNSSACPENVTVAVLQDLMGDDEGLYEFMAKHDQYADRLKIITKDASASAGPLAGLVELFKKTYMGEKYTLILPAGSLACSQWDSKLMSQSLENAAWTQSVPLVRQSSLQKVNEHSLMDVSRNWLRTLSQTQTVLERERTFPVFSSEFYQLNGVESICQCFCPFFDY